MLALFLPLLACSGDEEGFAPYVAIDAPLDGESFRDDTPVLIEGTVLDGDDPETDLVATFTAGDLVLCADVAVDADGLVVCEGLIPEGEQVLTLTGADPAGHTSTASITVVGVHDYPPTVTIDAPQDGQRLYAEAAVSLSGLVADDFDVSADLSAWWESDLDGGLGQAAAPDDDGAVATTVTLEQGDHVLTLYAQDTVGGVGSASVSVTVGPANSEPTCAITSPEDGDAVAPGGTASFVGTVSDPDQDADSLAIAWESSLDLLIGSDGPTADGDVALSLDTLSQGVHVITLTATDDAGLTCTDELGFIVGLPPVLTVLTPSDGETVHDVEGVAFYATAIDEDGKNTDITVTWTSTVDGEFASSAPLEDGSVAVETEALTPGAQGITVVATDADGLTDTVEVTFDVNVGPTKPIIEITPDPAYTNNPLVAVITSDSTDPEGAEVTYAWAWYVDGDTTAVSTTDTVEHALTSKGEEWEVVLTPHDGLTDGVPTSASLTISNTPPSVGDVTLSPDPGYLGATLSCETNTPQDDDTDAVTLSYDWTVSGVALAVPDPTLNDAYFGIGDTVQCAITPNDGYQDGTTVSSNEVTIDNQLPSVSSVSISPSTAYADDTLTCSYSGYTDPDGDPDASTFSWSIDGTEVGTAAELSGVFVRDDEVVCTVTPNDGLDDGTPVSASITIGNTAPSVSSAVIDPDPALASDSLSCTSVGYSDLDGDADASTVVWSVNGVVESTDATLERGFSGGDVVTCDLTAHDGADAGNTVAVNLTIDNTVPSLSSATISPNPATADDTLTCAWTGFDDLDDADSDESFATWSIDGVDLATGTTFSGAFSGGDTVTCTVTPFDGEDQGTPVSDDVVIDNTAPSIDSVTLSPSTATAEDTLSCQYSGYDDPDGDADLSTYSWTVNGSEVSTDSTLSGAFVGGDTVSCEVTPYDGSSAGTAMSDAVVIDNSPPVLADATISPSTAYTDDELTCTAGSTTDPDGTTSFSYLYEWTVDGVSVSFTDTLAADDHGRDDDVVCVVTPNDGQDDGSAVSSATLTISNTPPEVVSVSLAPASPATDDSLSATVETSDLDGDTVSVSYTWDVSGIDPGETSGTLDGAGGFDKGDEVTVTVVPDDGTDTGSSLTATAVTVVNTAPGQPTVDISPAEAFGGLDDLVCEIDNDADDVDGDPLTYAMSWTVDGVGYSDATTTTWSGDTVPASDTFGNEDWECSALPNDGDDDGVAGTANIRLDTCASVDFDGSSSYATVADDADLRLNTGNFTVEAWFQLDSLGADDVHLLSKRDGTSSWDGWVLGVSGTSSTLGSGKVFFARSETDAVVGSTTVTTGAWTHVAFVNDPTAGEVRIYLDGIEEDATSQSAPNSTSSDLVLGRDSASSANWLDGLLTEVRIAQGAQYSTDFSPDDELEPIPQDFLLLSFDEGSGSSLSDSSGNGNDASLTSGVWVTSCNFE